LRLQLIQGFEHEHKRIIYFAPGFFTCWKRSFRKREHYATIQQPGFFQLARLARQEELPQSGELPNTEMIVVKDGKGLSDLF
jgi:hypothetical protein